MAGLAKKHKIFELWVRVGGGMSQVINPLEYWSSALLVPA